MLASPGPWRLGVAVALRSRSPQTAAELARSGSIRFYSALSCFKPTVFRASHDVAAPPGD